MIVSKIQILEEFFAHLERLDFAAVAALCAPDCVYEDMPVQEAGRAVGPAAIVEKLRLGLGELERLPTTIHRVVEQGDTLLVERTEVWHHRTGERATLEVMAVFVFRDGRLTLWRDYWDMNRLFSQQPSAWVERMVAAGAKA